MSDTQEASERDGENDTTDTPRDDDDVQITACGVVINHDDDADDGEKDSHPSDPKGEKDTNTAGEDSTE